MKYPFSFFICILLFSCGNPAEEKKNSKPEEKDSTSTKEMDSSFSEENANELGRLLKENKLPDSVKIVEEVSIENNPHTLPD